MGDQHRKNFLRGRVMTRRGLSALLFAAIGCAATSPGLAADTASIEATASRLSAEYGRQQMQRLAQKNDRDSLIAAALVGLPNDAKSAPAEGHDEVVKRLVGDYPNDPLAMYVAALVCNVQPQPCPRGDDQVQLMRIASDNALSFLLLPNSGKPNAEQLHLAATAGTANSHHTTLLAIVRAALANQPAPSGQAQGADSNELALALRHNELNDLPWPMFGPVMELCSPAVAARREGSADLRVDCGNLGLALFSDLGASIVTRTYGGTLVRRFARGTPGETAAKAFRQQYLWLDQLPGARTSAEKELFSEESATLGEWEALQRRAERTTGNRAPPADWVPANPDALLLPEERRPLPSKK